MEKKNIKLNDESWNFMNIFYFLSYQQGATVQQENKVSFPFIT